MKSVEQLGRLLGIVVVLAVALMSPPPGWADVKPGDTVNKANADQVKDLVSPGVLWCVKRGLPIGPPRRTPDRRGLRQAALSHYIGGRRRPA